MLTIPVGRRKKNLNLPFFSEKGAMVYFKSGYQKCALNCWYQIIYFDLVKVNVKVKFFIQFYK